jgi:nucleotide-binding universal stress UspA family protein
MTPIFKHITVPVDGSTTAEHGVAFALELARDGGRVSFCSVVDPMLVCAPAAYGAALDPGPLLDELDADAEGFCRSAIVEAGQCHVDADYSVLHGQSIMEIEQFAGNNGSDAVVIGTHGRSGLSRAALGSVAEGVLRHMPIPVVCVHENDLMRTGPIAVAFDDSPAARAALDLAIAAATARGMSLLIVHARTNDRALTAPPSLDAAVARAAARGVSASPVTVDGAAGDAILRAADAHDCCMIVTGTHGRGPLAQLVLGSVAVALVERAHVPVITVRNAT